MPSVLDVVKYFLRLGALGFGGPVALAESMRRDLVETRRWITPEEYEDGLALSAACPGPLAYQLGVYCGYVRHGILGGLAIALAFGLPPFAIVDDHDHSSAGDRASLRCRRHSRHHRFRSSFVAHHAAG